MPELVFHTGPMDCGKSTLALQLHHTQSTHGRQGRLFTSKDRSGEAQITSRLGLSAPATEVGEEFDPHFHEALYQVPVPGDGEMHIQEVMQKGVRVGDSLVRPARVAVSVPNGEPAADADDAAQASDDPGTQTPGTQAPATDTPGTGTGN